MITEIEAFLFEANSGQFRYSPHEFDIDDYEHGYFVSTQIKRNELSESAESERRTITITTPITTPVVPFLVQAGRRGEKCAFKLLRGTPIIDGFKWIGMVTGINIGNDQASIRCESVAESMNRVGPREVFTSSCRHVVYSAHGCKAMEVSAYVTVVTSSGRNLYFDIPYHVQGALAGGWLETPSGERHMIMSEEYGNLNLLTNPGLGVGDTVKVVAACDFTLDTCIYRFNNLENNGGFPSTPLKNPFTTGVF